MTKLSTLEDSKVIHAIVFGPPKSGKSLVVGKLAEHGFNLYWFDLEQGRKVLYQLSRPAQERINIFNIPDIKDYPIAIETCLKVVEFKKVKPLKICDTHGKVDCALCIKTPNAPFSELDFKLLTNKDILVFDSLTQLSNSAITQIMKGRDELAKPEWEDFRNQGVLLDKFLGNIQNAPYHVIVISHESAVEMQDGKEKLVPVCGTRNFSRNTAKYFDEVIYMDIFNKRHRANSSTTAVTDVLTGSRSGATLEKNPEASILELFTGASQTVTQSQEAAKILHEVKNQ